MTALDDRANRIPWPPLLAASTLADAIVLEFLLPLGRLAFAPVRHLLGVLLLLGSLILVVLAITRFRAMDTPVNPTARAQALATGGIYGVSRNPMYLGMSLGFAGLALLVPLPWLLLLLPPLIFGLWHLAIRREEAYLERRFGAEYLAYKSRVRRWL